MDAREAGRSLELAPITDYLAVCLRPQTSPPWSGAEPSAPKTRSALLRRRCIAPYVIALCGRFTSAAGRGKGEGIRHTDANRSCNTTPSYRAGSDESAKQSRSMATNAHNVVRDEWRFCVRGPSTEDESMSQKNQQPKLWKFLVGPRTARNRTRARIRTRVRARVKGSWGSSCRVRAKASGQKPTSQNRQRQRERQLTATATSMPERNGNLSYNGNENDNTNTSTNVPTRTPTLTTTVSVGVACRHRSDRRRLCRSRPDDSTSTSCSSTTTARSTTIRATTFRSTTSSTGR